MGKNKRAQFFLVASLLIAALLISIVTVSNYARVAKEDTKFKTILESLSYESARVIDSGVYQSIDQASINGQLSRLAENYSISAPDSDLFVVYGNASNLTLFNYNSCNSVGSVGVGSDVNSDICISQRASGPCNNQRSCVTQRDTIILTIGDNQYQFSLQEGQNFYIVLKKDKAGETYVAKSGNGH
jgi:hypothetical protein